MKDVINDFKEGQQTGAPAKTLSNDDEYGEYDDESEESEQDQKQKPVPQKVSEAEKVNREDDGISTSEEVIIIEEDEEEDESQQSLQFAHSHKDLREDQPSSIYTKTDQNRMIEELVNKEGESLEDDEEYLVIYEEEEEEDEQDIDRRGS